MGLSASSWPLLQRLEKRSHVDYLALTPCAASNILNLPKDLLICTAFEVLSRYWTKGGVLLVVGSVGATTRLVSPLLTNKEDDPAVLVLDAKALHVVPLLGGHKGGAEELAIQLAEDLGGNPVITGDAWTQRRLPLDSFGAAWGWKRTGDRDAWHELMLQQASEREICSFQSSGSNLWEATEAASKCLNQVDLDSPLSEVKLTIGSAVTTNCSWHPATLWIGIGCERDTSQTLVERSLQEAFSEAGLAQEAVAGLASLEIKANESALLAIAKKRAWPIRFFTAQDLAAVSVPNPSEIVQSEVGTPSVAEAASLLASGKGGELIQAKHIYHPKVNERGALTVAIAQAKKPFAPSRGELHLVGSGPGDIEFLTNDARFALSKCVVWFGYSLYLDLLDPLRRSDQVRVDGQLTRERDRCLQALELATQGVCVALISSGDSGIYGMAGLTLELLLERPESQRPKFQVHPGISAIQMAACRVGAPLMNDFCAVSLSNRLTPWSKIEERLLGAAKGDFVIAIYNPQSKDRNWQLTAAIDLLLQFRPANTPVAIARQLGRAGETVRLFTLDSFPFNEVDMLTLVLIGNSLSLLKEGWFLTPRGYSAP